MKKREVLDSFMNDKENSFMDQFEIYIERQLFKREDYSELYESINDMEDKYPKVRQYLEDEKILDMSDDEKKTVLKIIAFYNEMKTFELKEAFKLGGKEMLIYLKEMDMLKI